jgi:hypothetical protein
VLQVVDHQQPFLLAQGVLEGLDERVLGELVHAEHAGKGRHDVARVADGRQWHVEHPIWEIVQELGAHLEGQARLAGAAGAGQGEQAHVGAGQELDHLGTLYLAPDKGRGLCGQVVCRRRRPGGSIVR